MAGNIEKYFAVCAAMHGRIHTLEHPSITRRVPVLAKVFEGGDDGPIVVWDIEFSKHTSDQHPHSHQES